MAAGRQWASDAGSACPAVAATRRRLGARGSPPVPFLRQFARDIQGHFETLFTAPVNADRRFRRQTALCLHSRASSQCRHYSTSVNREICRPSLDDKLLFPTRMAPPDEVRTEPLQLRCLKCRAAEHDRFALIVQAERWPHSRYERCSGTYRTTSAMRGRIRHRRAADCREQASLDRRRHKQHEAARRESGWRARPARLRSSVDRR